MIWGEMYCHWFIYYVAVCRFCAVRCLIIIYFSLLFSTSNYSTYIFQYSLYLFFLFFMFVFCFVYSAFLYCFVYYLYFCIELFPIFVQVYRLLPSGGNSTAVNKCHIISYIISYISHHIYHIISYITSHHITSRHIISCHIISYHIIYNGSVMCRVPEITHMFLKNNGFLKPDYTVS